MAGTKKTAVKKPAAKKTTAKKTTVKTTKKAPVVKKTTAKKPAVKKVSTPKKVAAKKTTISKAKTTLKKEAKVVSKQAKNITKKVEKEIQQEIKKVESSKLYKELALMFSRPDKFFATIKGSKDFSSSIFFIGLMGVIAAAMQIIFNLANIKLMSAALSVVTYPLLAIIEGFGIAGALMFASYACKGELNFEKTLKAVSYTTVLFPIAIALSNLNFGTELLSYVFNLSISLVYIYLLYNILVFGLKGNIKRALMFLVIAFSLVIIYMPNLVKFALFLSESVR
ncbi:MAG: hypothetical protein N4A44_02300 [Alphaproteobacteria bacterium]|jgi:hypothetical protein|nr:hypothetical protein [Alphaproteobacteria bacterium]